VYVRTCQVCVTLSDLCRMCGDVLSLIHMHASRCQVCVTLNVLCCVCGDILSLMHMHVCEQVSSLRHTELLARELSELRSHSALYNVVDS